MKEGGGGVARERERVCDRGIEKVAAKVQSITQLARHSCFALSHDL